MFLFGSDYDSGGIRPGDKRSFGLGANGPHRSGDHVGCRGNIVSEPLPGARFGRANAPHCVQAVAIGRIGPSEALWFGVALVVVGVVDLLLATNLLAAALALATSILYLGVYTPLKTRTTWCTAVGAIPGALPPLIGWVAASGSLSAGGWILFGILVLWQFPHFHAIAWMYREDYARAGIRMLPVVDPEGRVTFAQILWSAAILVPFSLLGAVAGLGGPTYFFSALVLGLMWRGMRVGSANRTNARAKWLMHATVLHLPYFLD